MNTILLILIIAIVAILLIKNLNRQQSSKDKESNAYVLRKGQAVKADEAFDASTSGDLNRMLKAVSTDTNPIDRHFLLQSIVDETYKKRKDQEMRRICKEIGEKHLSEFPSIAQPLKKEFDNILPRVITFQHLATVYSEDGNYDRAIDICKMALSYDLHDNTQSGFEGRIERIKKKKLKNQNKKKA